MNQVKIFCMFVAVGCMLVLSGNADAHGVFKKQLQTKYPNKKISCNACHVDKKPKTERNAYGKLFSKTFENKTLTKDWKSKKGAEKKTFETDVMAVEFNKAYDKVKAMTFHDLVEAGVIEGIEDKEEEK